MTVKHTLVSLDMRVFALCSLMELHRGKVTRIRRLVPIVNDLKDMPRLCKPRDRLFKRPDGFRRAGQKQQCLFLPLSVFQNVHVLSPVRRDGSSSKQLVSSNQMSQFHQLAISNRRSVKMPRKAAFYGFYCNAAHDNCQDSERAALQKHPLHFRTGAPP